MVDMRFDEITALLFTPVLAVFEDCKPFAHCILYSVHYKLYRFFKVWLCKNERRRYMQLTIAENDNGGAVQYAVNLLKLGFHYGIAWYNVV